MGLQGTFIFLQNFNLQKSKAKKTAQKTVLNGVFQALTIATSTISPVSHGEIFCQKSPVCCLSVLCLLSLGQVKTKPTNTYRCQTLFKNSIHITHLIHITPSMAGSPFQVRKLRHSEMKELLGVAQLEEQSGFKFRPSICRTSGLLVLPVASLCDNQCSNRCPYQTIFLIILFSKIQ